MLRGTNLQYTKNYNFRIVLETVRLFGPLSRADIARRTCLTAQTVSNIVGRLMEAELIREAAKRQRGRGAPSITLEINPSGAYSVGVDLDRDHLTGVLVDLSGAVQQRQHIALSLPAPEEAICQMADTTIELVAAQGLRTDAISGLGIGFPGPFEIQTENVVTNLVTPKAFPDWHKVPVVDLIKERIDCPIFLENNATAAAVGERWYGDGCHRSTFFYLFFGIGLGGGMIYEGQPYRGFFGNAGEVGYIPAVDGSTSTGYSHIGEYFNLAHLYDCLRNGGHSVSQPSDLQPLYDEDHACLEQWVEEATNHLVRLVLSIEYLIDPEIIFFGGRLPDRMIQDIMAGLEAKLPSLRISGKAAVPTLKRATAGEDAAALGVATLPLYEFFAPTPSLLMKKDQDDRSSTRRS